MSLGERANLIVPPDMAYGKRGYPGVYPFKQFEINRTYK